MARRLLTALVAMVSIGVLASCAQGSNGTGAAPGGSEPPSVAAPASASPSDSAAASAPASASPSSSAGVLTLTGQVEQGVEPGCLILRANGKSYELMSSSSMVKPGVTVEVTGTIQTGMMSHCQQGPILKVTSVRLH